MPIKISSSQIDALNRYINSFCENPSSYSELKQLHTLFTVNFRRALEVILNRCLIKTRERALCTVELAWIDKIPVAEFGAPSKRTEVGDAVIFFFDQICDPKGTLSITSSRALILQAKVARSANQRATPKVPISTGKSTDNELELLSNWPTFDLYKTGRSGVTLLKGVAVSKSQIPVPNAWFLAAPGYSSFNKSNWPCWWMAGKADKHASCDTSLGNLIAGFLSNSPEVGADFSLRGGQAFNGLGR